MLGINAYTYGLAVEILESAGGETDKASIVKFLHHMLDIALEDLCSSELGLDLESTEILWRRLHGYWVSLCGLPPLRKGVPVDDKALSDAVSKYGTEKIIQSIKNFAKIYRNKRSYSWVDRMEFDEFIVRGYEDFLTENNPFNKYRRVTQTDYDRFMVHQKKRGFKIEKRDLEMMRSFLERNIGRVTLGRDF